MSAEKGEIAATIEARLTAMADEKERRHLMRFFKTGSGEYGEGDRFLGVRVPATRAMIKEYRKSVAEDDCELLIRSEYHEVRLAGFLLLIEVFSRARKQKDETRQREIISLYLSLIHRGNNWDLVDMVAPKLLGVWLSDHPEEREILYDLADMEGSLWHQRVSMVTNWMLIRNGDYDDTLRLARKLLHHPHDLIHKATGWMLREVGKRGGMDRMLAFLDLYAPEMPRTMLRYAIEQLPETDRQHYLSLPRRP